MIKKVVLKEPAMRFCGLWSKDENCKYVSSGQNCVTLGEFQRSLL